MHLLNSLAGLTIVYASTSVPFSTWMLKGYFDTIPKEMEEAAYVDGASRWTTFWRIVLPLSAPALVVTALFSFMTAWNEFILASTLMTDARLYTLPVALQQQVGDFHTNWGQFAAGAILTSAPVMALFYALQKHLVGGLTAGGVKGWSYFDGAGSRNCRPCSLPMTTLLAMCRKSPCSTTPTVRFSASAAASGFSPAFGRLQLGVSAARP